MPEVGDVLAGKYQLERRLGAGGFAWVYAARNIHIDRMVALKVLTDSARSNPEVVNRLFREARLAALEIHPTVVRVEDIGQTDKGVPFLVMELVRGTPLDKVLKREGPLPVERSLEIITHVLEGLAAAHAEGIIHRDIKPSNIILVEPGKSPGPPVKILDMGIAKSIIDEDKLTATDQIIGTPYYLAPEVLLDSGGERWSTQVDVFAVGMMLFQMLTGRFPYDLSKARASFQILLSVARTYEKLIDANEELRGPADHAPHLSREVDELVRRSLLMQPSERFVDAAEMLNALKRPEIEARSHPSPAVSPAPPPVELNDTTPTEPNLVLKTASALEKSEPAPAPSEPISTSGEPIPAPGVSMVQPTPFSMSRTTLSGTPPKGRRGLLFAALGLVGVAAVAVGVAISASSGQDREPPPGSAASEAPVVRAEAQDEDPSRGPESAADQPSSQAPAETDRGGPAPARDVEAPAERGPRKSARSVPQKRRPTPDVVPRKAVSVRLLGVPDGARVFFAGEVVTGGVIRGKAGTSALLKVRAEGYQSYQKRLTLERDGTFDLRGKLRESAKLPVPSGERPGKAPGELEGPSGTFIESTPLPLD